MFCEQFHPRVGGAERQAQKLARALMDLGCNVEVLTPRHNPSWQSTEDVDGVRIHRFPYVDISSRVRGIRGLGVPNAAFGFWQVRRALHALMGRFDVLHGHIASPMVVYAMDCAHAAGRRAICKIAASGPRWDLEVLRRTSLAGGWLARHALARFDMWIAVSEGIRRQLEESGVEASRIRSIPNGVLVPKVEPGAEPAPARKFLYLGRLSATAGRDVPTLLRAFDQLARDLPDCELCLVGGGEHQGEIRELLASLPDAGRGRVWSVSNLRAHGSSGQTWLCSLHWLKECPIPFSRLWQLVPVVLPTIFPRTARFWPMGRREFSFPWAMWKPLPQPCGRWLLRPACRSYGANVAGSVPWRCIRWRKSRPSI